MAIYLSRKKGGVTPTSITPSNSSPAALTANSAVTPTANGYAIAGYDTVVPSGTPVYKNAGSIVQLAVNGGVIVSGMIDEEPSNTNPAPIYDGNNIHAMDNGYFIKSYDSVTPSSTPTSVSSGDIVKIGGSGVIVDSIPTPTSITPSNSIPVALTANTPVNPTASGYAISSYSSKTPSDSSPASVSSGQIIKASAAGYLVSTANKIKTGTFNCPASSTSTTVNCGFAPNKIFIYFYTSTSKMYTIVYDNLWSNTQIVGYRTSSSSSACTSYSLSSNNGTITGITSTGFTFTGWTSIANTTMNYVAIG